MHPCRRTCVIDEVAAVHSGYCCAGEKEASSPAVCKHSVCDVDVLQPGSGANVQEDSSVAVAIGLIKAAGACRRAKSVHTSYDPLRCKPNMYSQPPCTGLDTDLVLVKVARLNFSANMALPAVYPSRKPVRHCPPESGLLGHSGTELLVKVHAATETVSTPDRLRLPPRQAALESVRHTWQPVCCTAA